MGKTGRWIKNLLTGKKEKEREREKERAKETENDDHRISGNDHPPTTPISIPLPTTPKEKRRWSFRRSSAAAASPGKQDPASMDHIDHHQIDNDPKRHALAMAAATAADAAAAAAKAAAAVMQLTAVTSDKASVGEEAAATKIQAVFRAYLARKALNALKGLVKLQALVRGHLVRKQATATLRCMQALVSVQARARAQRLHLVEENRFLDQTQRHHFTHRKSTHENTFRNSNQDFGAEENIKIVEMDLGDCKPVTRARNSYSNHTQGERFEQRMWIKQEQQMPAISGGAPSDMSPRTLEEFSLGTAESSPQCYSAMSKPDEARLPFSYPRSEYAESLYSEYPFYPNYMANTQSSRAKVRSHSAPKQRPAETLERQPSRRRPSIEGRNVPRAVRMQRSSSHVTSAAQNYQYPWSVKLDRSAVSLKDSECGSSSTVLTNTNYCRSLVGFEVQGGIRY